MENDAFNPENLTPLVRDKVLDAIGRSKLTASQKELYEEIAADLVTLTLIVVRSSNQKDIAQAKADLEHVKASLESIKALKKAKAFDTTVKMVGKVMGSIIKAGIKSALPIPI